MYCSPLSLLSYLTTSFITLPPPDLQALGPFPILNGVRVTEEEFGRGSYAVVLRLEYRGLKCAGKKLYPALYEQGVGETVCRFEEE